MKKRVITLFGGIALSALASQGFAADSLTDNLSVTGFVDTSYLANLKTNQTTFSLDQFEVDFEKKLKGKGALRVDVNFGTGTGALSTDDVLEQGYITVDLDPITFLFGKFNAPIGFELLDAPDMYQFSHAMVFDFGLPTNLTGASVSGGFGIMDINIYVSNGWDKITDDNNEETIGGRFGLTPAEGINIGFSYITGDETGGGTWKSAENLSVFDIDFTFTGVPGLVAGAEFNSGTHEKNSAINPGVDDADWTAWLVMANYSLTDKAAVTVRYDTFRDSDGARLKRPGSGVSETRKSITLSPSLSLGDGFLGLMEYRYTSSDKSVFTDLNGNATDNESSLAVEFTYSF